MKTNRGISEFEFNGLYIENEKDKDVKKEVYNLAKYFVSGGNASIISYGQKGTGKSDFLWNLENGFLVRLMECIIDNDETEDTEGPEYIFSAARVADNGFIDLLENNKFEVSLVPESNKNPQKDLKKLLSA